MLAAGLALAGCKLIDQTTFAPSPEADRRQSRAAESGSAHRPAHHRLCRAGPELPGRAALRGAGSGDARTRGAIRRDRHAAGGRRCGRGAAPGGGGDARYHGSGRAGQPHPSRAAHGAGRRARRRSAFTSGEGLFTRLRDYTHGKQRSAVDRLRPLAIGRPGEDASVPRSLPRGSGRHRGARPLSPLHAAAQAGGAVSAVSPAGRQRGAGLVVQRLSRHGRPPRGDRGRLRRGPRDGCRSRAARATSAAPARRTTRWRRNSPICTASRRRCCSPRASCPIRRRCPPF